MIMKKILISYILFIAFVLGCTTDSKDRMTPTSSTNDINVVANPTSTQTTINPSPSPSLTALPILPTLPEEEAYNLLFDMLNPEDACELPCWLNTTPGKTSLNELYFSWAPLQGITATYAEFPATKKGDMDIIYRKDGYNLKIFTSYSVADTTGVINSLNVSTEVTHKLGDGEFEYTFTSGIYKTVLSKYLLSNILSTYGTPNQILIGMEIIVAEPTSPDFFHVWLIYPAIGTILEYTGSAEIKDGVIHACPSDTFVSLWLMSPEDPELFKNTLEEATGLPSSPFYKSTEDAIGKTVEEFYNEFKEPNSFCIESLLDIWPER